MKYQLVLQLPADSLADYDLMISLEEAIIDGLGELGDVDGHDVGAGETNIFIETDEPEAAFERVGRLAVVAPLLSVLRAGYRRLGAATYTVIHPKGLTEFRVA